MKVPGWMWLAGAGLGALMLKKKDGAAAPAAKPKALGMAPHKVDPTQKILKQGNDAVNTITKDVDAGTKLAQGINSILDGSGLGRG